MAVAKFDDWVIGVSGGVGYAGQAPFGDGNAYYVQADVVAFKQLTKDSALAIGIDYDGNRHLQARLPVPGRRLPHPTAGQPLPDRRRPGDRHQVGGRPTTCGSSSTTSCWTTLRPRVGYTFGKGFELFGAIGQRADAFFLDGAPDRTDRLLFQQKRAELGLTVRTKDAGLSDPDLELTVAAGYAWDGEFSVGFDSANSRLLTDVSDAPYIRFSLEARF